MESEKVEKLIELVREHVFLYDVSHQHYKNASLKTKVWESIGKQLNESGETVRSKWKTVRDGYTKFKKGQKCSTGSCKKNVYYTWASQLAFLDKYNLSRSSNSKDSFDATQNATSVLDADYLQAMASESNRSPVASSSKLPPSESSANKRKKKRLSEDATEDDGVMRMLQYLNDKKEKESDPVDNLFLSYADTFKRFPPREQAIVKLELAKLFSNIELQLLNNNYQYNISSPASDNNTQDSGQYEEQEVKPQLFPITYIHEN